MAKKAAEKVKNKKETLAAVETTTKVKSKKTSTKSKNGEQSLVIVESPAKAKTIKKMLGDSFQILASYGHIRDFPKKVLGIDVKENYTPIFEVIPEKVKVVNELNKAAKAVDKIYLAPDPDREGEAIAWHISEVLKFPKDNIYRIEFNEITQKAVTDAVNNPRDIDMNRVQAQQTRQILDRIVGYKISPVLWEKLKNNRLSAGRVQSVALRLVCEREAEIDIFVPQEYWTITVDLSKQKSNKAFSAELVKYKNEKIDINNEDDAQETTKALSECKDVKVSKVTKRETKRNPQPPFITSTLQREASSRLGYGVGKTMQIAQKLYEGIEIGSSGLVGLITYMRTDSTRIADEAREAAKEYIEQKYGKNFYPETPRLYEKKGKNVQDAHEAIRPSYIDKTPESIKQYLTNEQYRIYKLIWARFLASQMESARVQNTSIDISAGDYTLKTSSSKVDFDGFLIVYDDRNVEDETAALPELEKDEALKLLKVDPKQHFTQPPPRYTEASLVKILEELGIGRPSTYAPIISKIQQRNYVQKPEKALMPTLLGKTVNEQLVKHFSDIVDYNFTAAMETKLDDIADNTAEWKKVIGDFYLPFVDVVNNARQNMENVNIITDKLCPNCGKPMALKTSRWGTQFLGCTGYPECKTSLPLEPVEESQTPQIVDEKCDKCNSDMEIKIGPYGKYLQCTNEECKNRKRIVVKTGVKCPNDGCDGELVQKKSKRGRIFYACDKYPNCKFAIWNEPIDEKCPDCKSILTKKFLKKGNLIACSNKECGYSRAMEESTESDA
ncbi:MAG: type I DNA topoisomerase [Candidatus Gastranaerophilaceae bacterium]|jgi:DNA topoisomerase-1